MKQNVAIRQSTNENLNLFIDYLIDHGASLKSKRTNCYFSRFKYKKHEVEDFTSFIQVLKYLVNSTRDYYKRLLSTTTPFIIVAHDGWDSKDHDVLGVSVHFICPIIWLPINLAVGLQRIYSKTSASIYKAVMDILERYVFFEMSAYLITHTY
jgi:hypothetical protein